jgi:hypothetical protein
MNLSQIFDFIQSTGGSFIVICDPLTGYPCEFWLKVHTHLFGVKADNSVSYVDALTTLIQLMYNVAANA